MIVWSINSMNFVLGLAPHKNLPLPGMPPPTIIGHIEGAVPMGYSALFRKISPNVEFNGFGAVQMGHDVGFMIPHYNISPPVPPNTLLPQIISSSSCKITWGQSKVLVNNTPVGAWFPLLQNCLDCADPAKIPAGFLVDAAFRNTVIFSFNWTDFFIGLFYTGFESGSSYLLGRLCSRVGGKWLSDALGQRMGNLVGQQLLGRIGVQLNEIAVEKFIEKAYSTLLQKTTFKWMPQIGTGPLGDLIKGLGVPAPTPPAAAPHTNIVNSAPAVNGPEPDAPDGGLPPGGVAETPPASDIGAPDAGSDSQEHTGVSSP
jgi:hypothetical protein